MLEFGSFLLMEYYESDEWTMNRLLKPHPWTRGGVGALDFKAVCIFLHIPLGNGTWCVPFSKDSFTELGSEQQPFHLPPLYESTHRA